MGNITTTTIIIMIPFALPAQTSQWAARANTTHAPLERTQASWHALEDVQPACGLLKVITETWSELSEAQAG
jgi:hypothetical protein